jgi:hypothetical protein
MFSPSAGILCREKCSTIVTLGQTKCCGDVTLGPERFRGRRPTLFRQDAAVSAAWTFAWGHDHQSVGVTGLAHLFELLSEATEDARTSHTIAALVSPSGAELTIGLGRDRSIATFKASADPPYFVSRGTGSADDLLVFFYNGEWSEFRGDEAISVEAATAALGEFYETEHQPTGIAWKEV